jgi:alpha-ribazole phosphatase
MATRIILIRHAESEDNVSNIIQGQSLGSNLTERGIKQAEASAERLKDENVDAIYSSPTVRTKQTAEIINKYHNLEIQTEKNLKDRNFGILIGTPRKEADMTEEQKEMHKLRKEYADYDVPEGESFNNVKERTRPIIKKILEKYKNKTIVIVSHGNTIRAIVCDLLNIPIKDSYKMKGAVNCGYTEIKINGRPELIDYFCDKHLSEI